MQGRKSSGKEGDSYELSRLENVLAVEGSLL